jgi:hypothetical protein
MMDRVELAAAQSWLQDAIFRAVAGELTFKASGHKALEHMMDESAQFLPLVEFACEVRRCELRDALTGPAN